MLRLEIEQLESRLAPAMLVPDDPAYPDQYGLGRIAAPAAWGTSIGTGRTIVAVLDTGLDTTHPDLAGNLWVDPARPSVHGYDFVADTAVVEDFVGHGTHVAGIIGAIGDNGVGVTGINWHARLMSLRVLGGSDTAGAAARAIDFAIAHGAKVLNASWVVLPDPRLEAAIGRARDAGVILVAAAGNDGADFAGTPVYPAAYVARYDNVLAVASTDAADRLAATSGFGAGVALAAPGVDILSTLPGGRYGRDSGTSMAAAFVSGAASLIWDARPGWTYRQVLDRLKTTVEPVSGLAGKVDSGGRLDLARLLALPSASPVRAFAVGSADGTARLIVSNGSSFPIVAPFGERPPGGVRATAADLTGDGVPDLIAASGPGGSALVFGYDGATGVELFVLRPFEESFTGGVFVTAGDIDADGIPELVVTPDQGGGPRVRVLDGRTRAVVADFFGIDDPAFRGGCRATIGDLTGDGKAELVVAAGAGGGPRVAVFTGASVRSGAAVRLLGDFFVFEPELRNGVYIAVGDLTGSGRADLIVGGGPGGGPRVQAFSGAGIAAGLGAKSFVRANLFVADSAARDGASVVVADLDGDVRADLVTAADGSVRAYAGNRLIGGDLRPLFDLPFSGASIG